MFGTPRNDGQNFARAKGRFYWAHLTVRWAPNEGNTNLSTCAERIVEGDKDD